MKKEKIRVDLHVHTTFSRDSSINPDELVEHAKNRSIDVLAITDHNEIQGALNLKKKYPDNIIVGEEIMTLEGEIIGLFLTKHIKPFQSPKQTIKEIKSQGGIVYVPHPFDPVRANMGKNLNKYITDIDIVEVFNSKVFLDRFNNNAREFAIKNKLLMGAGSDSHSLEQIGKTYVQLDAFKDKNEFLQNLDKANIIGTRICLIEYLKMANYYIRNLLKIYLNKRKS